MYMHTSTPQLTMKIGQIATYTQVIAIFLCEKMESVIKCAADQTSSNSLALQRFTRSLMMSVF